MAGPPRFGLEVVAVPLRGRDHMRDAARDIPSELFQLLNLARVVRHQVNGTDVEACQHVRRDLVVTLVVPEPKGDVGVHRVEPLVLERVGADLVDEPYSSALLPHVENETAPHGADLPHRNLELIPAVAAQRSHHVACEAFRMEPGGNVLGTHHVTVDHGHVLFAVAVVPEGHDVEPAELAR